MKLLQYLRILKPKCPKNIKIRLYKRKINKIVGGINLINWTITDVGQLQKNLENDAFKNSELKELSEKLINKLANLINKYNKIL